MTTNEPNTSAPDYSEAFIRIQYLHKGLQKQVQARDYVAARNSARLIALEAMHIGIWCKQFIGEEK